MHSSFLVPETQIVTDTLQVIAILCWKPSIQLIIDSMHKYLPKTEKKPLKPALIKALVLLNCWQIGIRMDNIENEMQYADIDVCVFFSINKDCSRSVLNSSFCFWLTGCITNVTNRSLRTRAGLSVRGSNFSERIGVATLPKRFPNQNISAD